VADHAAIGQQIADRGDAGARRPDDGVVLELPATGSLFVGEAVQRRLDALGRSLGVESRTVRRRSPSRVLA